MTLFKRENYLNKIDKVYLTGTVSVINNIDIYASYIINAFSIINNINFNNL